MFVKLSLTWKSFRDNPPPDEQIIEVENKDATLGRAFDSVFVIHDPERFASRLHAIISRIGEDYYIEDKSRSGTLINKSVELKFGQRHKLHNSDYLTIGECGIEVSIEKDTPSNIRIRVEDEFNIDDFFGDSLSITDLEQTNNPLPAVESKEAKVPYDTLALRAFLSELQIEPESFIGENKIEVMQVAGVVLRTLTQGMMDVLQARTSIKQHFNMDNTQMQSVKNNPLKFSANSIEAMTRMLKRENGFMDAIESAEEAVNDARAHELAMIKGLNAAAESIISTFDPIKLETEFDKTSSFSIVKGTKYWALFQKKHKKIAQQADSISTNEFARCFRQEYEEQIQTLSQSK